MKDWIVTYVDGKIASVTRDFKAFADIARAVAQMPSSSAPSEMHSGRITTDELLMMATTLRWEDLRLFDSTVIPISHPYAPIRGSVPSRMLSP